MKQLFLTLLLLLFTLNNFCQTRYEYLGALKLNGSDKTTITYRLVFDVSNNLMSGYSVTDLGGENETKNSISGTYDNKTKVLEFKEDDILYTKSNFSEKSFCFVNYSGKIKLVGNNTKLEGDFKGLYKNNKKCIDGTILLIGSDKIYKLFNKINTKIQKSKKVDEAIKKKLNPINILDSLKVNNLVNNQNLNVFIKSEKVVLEIWDAEIEDGDKINLFQNDKQILNNYEILNAKKKIAVNLENGQNTFRIEAINEGNRGFNTATIQIIDNQRTFDLKTNLKKDQKASITLIKKMD
jgi:hypothetical protein